MDLSHESLGFSVDGSKNHAEIYALLSEAKALYLEALQVTTSDVSSIKDLKTLAGLTIFRGTLKALSHSKKEGHLPLLGQEPFDDSRHNAILPPPILVAMNYLLDQETYISLSQLEVTSGHPNFDNAVVPWSKTILWSLPAKQRFFYELLEMYSGLTTKKPLLQNSRIRAAQLLALGNFLVSRQIERVGPPPYARIFTPQTV